MPQGTSARPGPWITETFQREPMDSILSPQVRELVWMKSTQIGGSEMLNNVIGYFIDADPRSMMLIQPKDQSAREYTEKRINPMIEACSCLRDKVQDAANSSKHGSQRLKKFASTCFLKIVGANSAADLKSDPVGVLLFDEVDGYDDDVQGEGDPIDVATRRTDQYDEEKVAKIGTPAKNKGFSRIEKDYKRSSQGRYFVHCPFCQHLQALCWRGEYRVIPDPKGIGNDSYEYIGPDDQTGDDGKAEGKDKAETYNFRFERDANGDVIESSVRYICAGCGHGIDEKYKQRMLDGGRWIHKFPARKKIRGYHIWAAYSPWKPVWHSLCQEWVEAQGNPEKLKPFVNLRLGETWNEGASEVDLSHLPTRKEAYIDDQSTAVDVPKGVGVLVAAADIQHNRIEAQIIGFGRGEESWVIDHEIFYGDPGNTREAENKDSVWSQLDEWLLKDRRHDSGAIMHPSLTLVDSGDGGNVDAVYDFVMPRQNVLRRVFACKGVERLAKPVLVQMGTTKRGNIRLWSVSTEAAKDRVFARLKIKNPGPGFMHFPDWLPDEYFAQLTSEKKVPVKNKFTRRTTWRYVRVHQRNEALDLTVYCHGSLFVLQKHFDPATYGDLGKLVDAANDGKVPDLVRRRDRRVLSEGVV